MRRTQFILALLVAMIAGASAGVAADAYPTRPINLIVPLSPGNTVDVLARIYADKLTQVLGQPVIVLNRTGAGGVIAAQTVATAAPDGYTILMANSGHAILGVLNKNLPFDPIKDFAGLATVGEAPALVVVTPKLGVQTLQQFVDLAKSKPGQISYGSAGIGTATHLAGAYFAHQAGINLSHVPYRNGSELIPDMLSGRVQAVFAPAAFTLPLLRDHRLTVLAVAAPADLTTPLPVPSTKSQGVDYVYSTWYGFLAPAKTPPEILQKLSSSIAQVSADPDIIAKVNSQGITPRTVTSGDFDAYIRSEFDRLGPVLKTLSSQLQ